MQVSLLYTFWHRWAQWITGGDAWSLVRTGADILIVAYLVYRLMMLAKGTRAWQIITGLVVFVGMLLFSTWARLSALSWILQQILPLGPVAIVILFFPELRHALEEVGRLGFWGKGFTGLDREDLSSMVGEIVQAAESLSDKKIGALLVLERETGLSDIVETGTLINSEVSADLLCTLFYPGSPLHDGAAVIRRDRIVAAGCTLPLSESRAVQGMQVHTRHKAALGISEQSDALVVVVSEETGIISLAFEGKMARGLRDDGRLRDLLIREYTGRENPSLRRRRGIIRPRSAKKEPPAPRCGCPGPSAGNRARAGAVIDWRSALINVGCQPKIYVGDCRGCKTPGREMSFGQGEAAALRAEDIFAASYSESP